MLRLCRALAPRTSPMLLPGTAALRRRPALTYLSTAARPAELFGGPVRVSAALQKVLDPDGGGEAAMMMARSEVTKQLWVYIKRHDLQHPDDRRHIVNDQTMREVFECDEMSMFEMIKLVQKHFN